jgi:hypothetical protein
MTRRSVEALVDALNAAAARYLVAGGLAVVAHGYVRLTADVDLVLDLEEGNLRAALGALESLGYRPRAPVALGDFVDPATRAAWMRDKDLVVFSLFSPAHPMTEVDIFVEPPIAFAAAYERAARLAVGAGIVAPFVSLDDLIAMKRAAARPQDLIDIEHLGRLRKDDA